MTSWLMCLEVSDKCEAEVLRRKFSRLVLHRAVLSVHIPNIVILNDVYSRFDFLGESCISSSGRSMLVQVGKFDVLVVEIVRGKSEYRNI